jgi:23S rRNA (cytosine1962-C5)-methyltransferase
MTPEQIHEAVKRARQRRAGARLPSPETDAFRLIHEASDGLPGLVVERFGSATIVHIRDMAWQAPDRLIPLLDALAKVSGQGPLRFVIDVKGRTTGAVRDAESALIEMASAHHAGWLAMPELVQFHEGGRTFEADLRDGFGEPLFTDMRGVRSDLEERWRGKRILNVFAYTCAFSVYLAQRNHVTNVDVSKRYLDVGRAWHGLNGLDASADFVVEDAFTFLEAARASKKRWDAVILDPPAQSHGKPGKSRAFNLRSDLGRLVELGCDVLAPEGELFVATNLRSLNADAFRRLVRGVVADWGLWVESSWNPQPDYPVSPADWHLKTALCVRRDATRYRGPLATR